MSNEHYPYLCGGILLNLLIETKKTPVNSREKLNCKKSSVSDSNILKGLIKLVTGEEVIASAATLKKDTSRYKRCEINNSSIITFTDSSTVKIFRDRVKNSCWEILDETTSFITTFLSEAKLEWFTKAILEIITNDTSIPDNTYFKTTHMKKIKKKELKYTHTIEIEIFLISVLIYIIDKKQNNKLGRTTIEKYFTQNGAYTQWKLTHPIGETINQNIHVNNFGKTNSLIKNNNTLLKNKKTNINKEINYNNFVFTYNQTSFSHANNSLIDYNIFYNLIVGGIEHADYKNGSETTGSFIIHKDRVINAWCDDLVKPLSILGIKERETLTLLPTIFVADQGCNKNNKENLVCFGYVKRIDVSGNSVKVVFDIHSKFRIDVLYENNLELGIERFELNNTHWAVKQVNLERELTKIFNR